MATAGSSSIAVPSDFICPITNAVMEHPVMDREGNSYEESAILLWLSQGNATSPITRNPLCPADLVINRALKNSVEQFLRQNQGQQLSVTRRPVAPKDNNAGDQKPTTTPTTTGVAQQQQPPEVKLLHDDQGHYLLSIQPPAAPTNTTTDSTNDRLPVDVICVIDISGSMNSEATVQNEKNEVESHGLTVFNVVVHACKTVSKLLGPNDRFALVTFNHQAQTVFGLTAMDPAGKKLVEDKLEAIQPQGRTNLWDGLQTAMDMVKDTAPLTATNTNTNTSTTQRTTSIMLLTDGQPNMEPPRGHLPTLRQYLSRLSPSTCCPFTVNTFGFGFDLDSTLLNDLAMETGGMYVFIPDSGLVGTVFVNCVANVLVTMASNVTVSIEAPAPVKHSQQLAPTQFGGQGGIGSLQYGQSRDCYFSLSAQKGSTDGAGSANQQKVFAKVDMVLNNQKVSVRVEAQPASAIQAPVLKIHGARSHFCQTITTSSVEAANKRSLAQLQRALTLLKETGNGCSASPMLTALLQDLEGEVTLAYSQDKLYSKWGRHYLPSLVRANVLQQCNNFKDKTVQLYGGALFAAVRDAGETTFLSLPPPVPKARPNRVPAGNGGGFASGAYAQGVAPAARAAPVAPKMDGYYNRGGGCVAGDSLVALAHGQSKRACEVTRGDLLSNGAVVDCRVEIRTTPDLVLVEFAGGLSISPYHPIRHHPGKGGDKDGARWIFPADSEQQGMRLVPTPAAPTIYSFLLRSGSNHPVLSGTHPQWLSINGVQVVAMAHGLTEDGGKEEEVKGSEVVAHSYFGTDRIRQDLQVLPGYTEEGVVQVAGWTRDPATMKVDGLVRMA